MSRITLKLSVVALAGLGAMANLLGQDVIREAATPAPGTENSTIQHRVNINVEKHDEEIHLINTTNDPSIITKVYILQHADPYEIQPVFTNAVSNAMRLDQQYTTGDVDFRPTKVEAIKYEDGTAALIISAEDYRFGKQKHGMGFDELVEALDQPGIRDSSGADTYLYFPKYWSAGDLRTIVNNHILSRNTSRNMTVTRSSVQADGQLNALLFTSPKFFTKETKRLLELYDGPTTEVDVVYTVYELDSENDDKVGLDFQAWKAGPGADMFSTAGRFATNWAGTASGGVVTPNAMSSTRYIQFSPRWNTRYLDFLAAKGKASVITEGRLAIMNNTTGTIAATTRIPRFSNNATDDGIGIEGNRPVDLDPRNVEADYIILDNATLRTWAAGTNPTAVGDYRLLGYTHDGRTVTTLDLTNINLNVTQYRLAATAEAGRDGTPDSALRYEVHVRNADRHTTASRRYFLVDGREVEGSSIQLYRLTVERSAAAANWGDATNPAYTEDRRLAIGRGRTTATAIEGYGFNMTIRPIVAAESTTLRINVNNTSLVGFSDDGRARLARSEFQTRAMASNSGQKFVIGGIEKHTVVRSTSKLPWLGDLPVLGWILGSEADSSKKSQVVSVIELLPLSPTSRADIADIRSQVEKATAEAGETNSFKNTELGFDQFLFDKNKVSFDPLP